MRDPKRIGRILQKLRWLWDEAPDLRLGQLILNLGRRNGEVDKDHVWAMEDDAWDAAIEARLAQTPRPDFLGTMNAIRQALADRGVTIDADAFLRGRALEREVANAEHIAEQVKDATIDEIVARAEDAQAWLDLAAAEPEQRASAEKRARATLQQMVGYGLAWLVVHPEALE